MIFPLPAGGNSISLLAAALFVKPAHLGFSGPPVAMVYGNHDLVPDGDWIVFQKYGRRCEEPGLKPHECTDELCADHHWAKVTGYFLATK